MNSQWTVLVDFDGTLTAVDADIHIAQALLSPPRYEALAALFHAYEAVEIGITEYFDAFLSWVDLDSAAFGAALREVPIRRDIVSLVTAAASRVNVVIASEGLDVYIHPMLETLGLKDVPLVCNRVRIEDGRPVITPDPSAAPCDRCLSCKGSLVQTLRECRPNARIALIGNGASDLCAAKEADVVFARDSLKRGCDKRGIPYVEWSEANDILEDPRWQQIMGEAR